MITLIRPAAILLVLFSILTGVLYPLVVTGLAQAIFPHQANGSLVKDGKSIVGSELIGQPFTDPRYFWSRPSATALHPYNASASAGSNVGPSNPALHNAIKKRIAALQAADPTNTAPIPVDLVTASGSGLDPHISLAAAHYQVPRVARARGISEVRLRKLVLQHTQARALGVLGEPTITVLQLNKQVTRTH